MNRFLGFVILLIPALLVGCGAKDKPTFANVKGKVTFNDMPIDKGKIIFTLEGRAPSTIDIVNGKFSGQAMVGSNKVAVSAKKRTAKAPTLSKEAQKQMEGYKQKFKNSKEGSNAGTVAENDANMVDYMPPEWKMNTSTQTRVVEAGQPNEFEIDIKAK